MMVVVASTTKLNFPFSIQIAEELMVSPFPICATPPKRSVFCAHTEKGRISSMDRIYFIIGFTYVKI